MISQAVFYDTSAWIALYDRDDEENKEMSQRHYQVSLEKRQIVTTNFVFSETHAYFSRSPKTALQIGETIRSSRVVSLQRVTVADEERAWEILKKYKDKDFSFCDTTSFAVIERLKIPFALSFDDHFKQYGIQIFPTP